MDIRSLEAAFRQGFGIFLAAGSREQLLAFLDDRALIIDQDLPFVMNKAQYQDHLDFHLASWESGRLLPYETRYQVEGDTGIVSTAFSIRGKPKGSGFRLRHGLATVVCHHDQRGWRAVSVTFDPLLGHIDGASPA